MSLTYLVSVYGTPIRQKYRNIGEGEVLIAVCETEEDAMTKANVWTIEFLGDEYPDADVDLEASAWVDEEGLSEIYRRQIEVPPNYEVIGQSIYRFYLPEAGK